MSTLVPKSLLSILALLIGIAPCMAAGEMPYSWFINANGQEGTLEIATGPGGRVTGTLLEQSVEGWLAGRHLVLARQGAGGQEIWKAWIATPSQEGSDQPVIAGTFVRPAADGPLPWFGVGRSVDERDQNAPTVLPTVPQAPPLPTPAASSPPSSNTPTTPATLYLEGGQPSLAGTWSTPDGPLEIRQEGSRLTLVLPDREVSGRLTGPDSLIVGFAPGCCKGKLEQGFTIIAWDNGSRWSRVGPTGS
ncbi:MAG: hypothetical protein ABFS37_13770 [Acidobacteriota bacterium]